MKRFVLISSLLASAPVVAAPYTMTMTIPAGYSGRSTATSDESRVFALAGSFARLDGKTCQELSDVLFLAIFPRIGSGQRERINLNGATTCVPGGQGGAATEFYYRIIVDPRTDADMPAVEAYLEEHEGLMVEGNRLHYVRVFGIIASMDIRYEFREGDESTLVSGTKSPVPPLFLNFAQLNRWIDKGANRFGSVDGVLAWLGGEMGKSYASYVREALLPETNYIYAFGVAEMILDDRRVVRRGVVAGPFQLDCRESDSGYCI